MMMKEFQSSLWGASKKREASVPIPEDEDSEDEEGQGGGTFREAGGWGLMGTVT